MKKVDRFLITGFSGFVGRHFITYLQEHNIEATICGVDINEPKFDLEIFKPTLSIEFQKVDLLQAEDVKKVISEFKPDYILHLASFSSVAYSWQYPAESFANNTNIFLNLIAVIRDLEHPCRILSVGSSEEYGDVKKEDVPLKEDHLLKPVSPYAVARISQEMLSKVFVDGYQLDIIMTRSFNHIGVWQESKFVIPSFVDKILVIKESGRTEGTIECGDTSIIRDFVDVRDVVAAYYQLLKMGKKGEIYNICTGNGHTLSEIIEIIGNQLGITVHTQINPQFVRPNDNKIIIGDNTKIREELGWTTSHTLEETLKTMIESKMN